MVEEEITEVQAVLVEGGETSLIPLKQIEDRRGTELFDHPVVNYLASLQSAKSRKTMERALRQIAEIFTGQEFHSVTDLVRVDWSSIRRNLVLGLQLNLNSKRPAQVSPPRPARDRLKANTINTYMAALRGVLKECRRRGWISESDLADILDIKAVKGGKVMKGRALKQGEVENLFQACEQDETVLGVRDAAIIGLLHGCGLRRSEVAGLSYRSINLDEGHVQLTGKGNKERVVKLSPGAQGALTAWIKLRGSHTGALFVAFDPGAKKRAANAGVEVVSEMHGLPLSDKSIANILNKLISCVVGAKSATPHDMRRTYITSLLEQGVDIRQVMRMAGHESTDTTLRYDRSEEKSQKEIAGRINTPYVVKKED